MTFSNELPFQPQIVPFYICHKWQSSVINDIFISISLITHLSFLFYFENQNLCFTSIFPLHLVFPPKLRVLPSFLLFLFFLISIPGGISERDECCILSRLVYLLCKLGKWFRYAMLCTFFSYFIIFWYKDKKNQHLFVSQNVIALLFSCSLIHVSS